MNASPILEVRADAVREVTSAIHQGRCVAILAPEAGGSSTVLQLAADQLAADPRKEHLVAPLNLPRGSKLPINDFFRSTLRHLLRRLRTAEPDLPIQDLVSELYGDTGQSLLPESHSAALHFEEVLALIADEILIPRNRRLVIAADHLGKVSQDHLREFGNIIHRLWEELDGHLVLLTAGAEALYTLCRRGSGDGHFSAFHIAHRVELHPLNAAQSARFIDARLRQLGLQPTAEQRRRLLDRAHLLTAGHPYFLDRLLNEVAHLSLDIATEIDPDDLGARIAAEDDHLDAAQGRILDHLPPRMRDLVLERLRQTIAGPAPSHLERDPAIETLRWIGFITPRDQLWAPTNWIYEHRAARILDEAARRAATADPPPTHHPGDLVAQTLDAVEPPLFDNRYRILRSISSGAFGAIFQATDTLLGTTVALKRLHAHLSSGRVLERFRREVLIARRLSHPNIVRVHDIGLADGAFYYTMEFVDGGNLADRFASTEGRARWALLPLIVQLCNGLSALHAEGIVHRDLKPENALIDHDGHVKLADFGISVALDMGRLTGAGAVGTPLYMSPEQTTGEEITPASDLYTVGVLLYELFAGHPPFRSEDIRTLMAMHVTREPDDLLSVAPDTPPQLAALIHQCLAKSPYDRPPWAHSIAVLVQLTPRGA